MRFRQVLNVMEYIRNETETAPLTEALFQLGQIFRLLDKRSELNLASRLTVGIACKMDTGSRIKTFLTLLCFFTELHFGPFWNSDEESIMANGKLCVKDDP